MDKYYTNQTILTIYLVSVEGIQGQASIDPDPVFNFSGSAGRISPGLTQAQILNWSGRACWVRSFKI